MAGVLDGIRVLDFSRNQTGALTAMVLSDYGAEVIKVEPPTGDPYRKNPAWTSWNRGKKGVTLDLETDEGKRQAPELAKVADVLVESFRPGAADRMGIGYSALSKVNPGLVYTSITGWGQKGRFSQYKDYEPLVVARMGRMIGLAGLVSPEKRPTYAAVQVSGWGAESAAIRGILAALHVREKTGRGQWVQTSILQGTMCHDFQGLIGRQMARRYPKNFNDNSEVVQHGMHTYIIYFTARTKDGLWMQMANNTPRLFFAFIKCLGLEDVVATEEFKGAPARMTPDAREALRELILDKMLEKTAVEWTEIFVKDGNIGSEVFTTAQQAMDHPQMLHNKSWVEVQDPKVGTMKQFGPFADLRGTPGKVQGPAPTLGQHNAAVLGTLGRTPVAVKGGSNGHNAKVKHPLEDITILDLSSIHAGPLSQMLMADFGARVIKLDPTPEKMPGEDIQGPMPIRLSAGKENIQIDLQTVEGQEILHRLIAKADVIFHNMRVGVPERLKFDYATCKKINPKIIFAYMGVYGDTGPYAHRPGAHPIPASMLGGALLQAGPSMPPPAGAVLTMDEIKEAHRWLMKANEGNVDQTAGFGVATGIMLAIFARDRTGEGQSISMPMINSYAMAHAEETFNYAGRPPRETLDAGLHGLHALWRLYRTADEGWVFLACPFDEEWEAFCKTVGRADLTRDPRFRTEKLRRANDAALAEIIEGIFQDKPAAKWEELLTAADVGCVQANGSIIGRFLEEDQHVKDNGLLVEVEHARYGKYLRHGSMVHLSETPAQYRPGTMPGQHTRELMKEIGYTQAQMDGLRTKRVIEWVDVKPMAVP